MKQISSEMIEFLRKQYPKGSRVTLERMCADPRPLSPGSAGTLHHIDDAGTFHVTWDNGRRLGVIPCKDEFFIRPPEPQLLKLYMPLTVTYEAPGEDDDMEYDEYTMSDGRAAAHIDLIRTAILEERGHHASAAYSSRGMMAYYDRFDDVDQKVLSYEFAAEVRDGRLWGVAECRVQGELTPDELKLLKADIEAQAADGFGESFSQREIETSDGLCLHVNLWTNDPAWGVFTEQELYQPEWFKDLPAGCYSTLPSTGELIVINRGEAGYFNTMLSKPDPDENRRNADAWNAAGGVTKAQEAAMLAGSMVGWHVPAANPRNYDEAGLPIKQGRGEARKESLADQIAAAGEKASAPNSSHPTEKSAPDR